MAEPTPAAARPEPTRRAPTSAVRRGFRRVDGYVKSKLVWNNVYRTASYLKSALWTIPFLAILLVLAMAPLLRIIDGWLGWRLVGLGVAGAQSLYQTVITLTLSFIVFTFGSLLVALQVASGQLTPRIIATTLLRDNVVRFSVGLFVFSLVFAIMALNRLEETVYEIAALISAGTGIASMVTFLFLIDYAARLLRPVSILSRVGNEGLAVIQSVYPNPLRSAPDAPRSTAPLPDAPTRIVPHTGAAEVVLAVDLPTLLREAERADGKIEFVPMVGDFVATNEPLFVLHGGATAIDDAYLRTTVAFGTERTMEQDPLFSFRIMADIALKALSPAINDPTTAVLALDQLHRLLREVGQRQLRETAIRDKADHRRIIYRTPNWEDFVWVSCREIRMCGVNNVQIARRLRAMLDDLISTLPAQRRPALEEECRTLTRAIESVYPIPEDLALAQIADSQGIGGSSRE